MDTRSAGLDADVWTLRIARLFALALTLDVVLLLFVVLKEDPSFWRNEGGYPVWLRDLVLAMFFPLLTVQLLVLGVTTICQCRALPGERDLRLGVLAGMVFLWLWFGIVLTILLWNNVENLLEGRDFHYHPVYRSQGAD